MDRVKGGWRNDVWREQKGDQHTRAEGGGEFKRGWGTCAVSEAAEGGGEFCPLCGPTWAVRARCTLFVTPAAVQFSSGKGGTVVGHTIAAV